MSQKIYGVDISKKITPVQARDAIIMYFLQAHKEILDMMDEFAEWKSKQEREKFRRLKIDFIIKKAFKEVKGDFENPTKQDLIKVVNNLAKFALQFRKPEIVKKHHSELSVLVNKLD